MFAVALIFFREVLEAALVIGILAAATTGLPGRTRWILTGVGAGLAQLSHRELYSRLFRS